MAPRRKPAGPRATTASKTFDYDRDYERLDLRKHPELYRVGRGEQGVLPSSKVAAWLEGALGRYFDGRLQTFGPSALQRLGPSP